MLRKAERAEWYSDPFYRYKPPPNLEGVMKYFFFIAHNAHFWRWHDHSGVCGAAVFVFCQQENPPLF